jgi:hypothetical protein
MSTFISSNFATNVSTVIPIAISPIGNIYLQSNLTNQNIIVFNSYGTQVTTITASDWYYSFTIDYSNNLMYCGGNNGSLGVVNLATNTITNYTGVGWLNGIALGPNGFIYGVAGANLYSIKRINPANGTNTTIFTASGNVIVTAGNTAFRGITFDSSGNFYCSTSGTPSYIYKFDISGNINGLFATLNSPYGGIFSLTCDTRTNTFYGSTIGSTGAIYKITSSGVITVYALTTGPSYCVFYDKIGKQLVASDSKTNSNVYFLSIVGGSFNVNNSNLINYYPFDKDTLDYASGTGTSNATITSVSLSSSATVISSGSLLLPGTSSQIVQLPNIQFGSSGLTIALWMKCVSIPTNWMRIFDFARGPSDNEIYLGFPSAGSMQMGFYNTSIGTGGNYNLNYSISDTNWHHYVFVISSNGTISLYVDGATITNSISTKQYPSLLSLTTNYLGKSFYSNDGYLNAYMNQFLIFNRVITSTEVAYLANYPSAVTFSNLSTQVITSLDTYSINPPTLTYGSSAAFQLSYSSQLLVANATYSLKNGSTTLDSEFYKGYFKGGVGLLVYTSTVDQSGTVWIDSGAVKPLSDNLTSILKQSYSPFSNISVAYPTYAGVNVYSRLRYYNNLIYYIACGGWEGIQTGYFGVMNPTTQSFTSWYSDTNVSRYHNDIAISQEGVGYACSAVWNNGSTKLTHQWKIDKINLQTGALTNLINGTFSSFETVKSGSQDGLSGITFDSSDNFYVLTYSGYITKWSKTGTQLMTPRQFNDPLGGVIPGSGRFDCDKSTNNLYIGGSKNNLCLINTTTLTVTNVLTLTTKVFDPCIDNERKNLYFSDSNVSIYRLDLNPVPTIAFNVTLTNITANTLQIYDASGNPFGVQIAINGTYPCFLQGSKILKLDPETDEEYYVPVESLRQGDLIRTATCGYKAVAFIGKGVLRNPADDPDKKNRLYKFQDSKKRYPPLYITGEHCLLYKEKDISEAKRREVKEHMGDDYITETYHRVPACLDDKGSPYDKGTSNNEGPVTIWHFALEHNNLYNNYAVWANGILVETCSIDFLTKKSNMELV